MQWGVLNSPFCCVFPAVTCCGVWFGTAPFPPHGRASHVKEGSFSVVGKWPVFLRTPVMLTLLGN